ncbi:MAG: hypothetical protein Q8M79_10655 [Dehalococcoidia bacterium]|nr:hypothetical protein [Dehalococcoidia bacterium]
MRRAFKILGWVAAFQAVAYLVTRTLRTGASNRPDPFADEFTLAARFEASDFGTAAPALRRATVRATFAGVHLDLRDATLAEGGARLDLHATFGAIEVVVRPEWRVVMRGTSFAGSLTTGVTAEVDLSPDAPSVVIDARATFGAVHVRAAVREGE